MLKDMIGIVIVFTIILIGFLGFIWMIYDIGKRETISELCNKKQYDFCEPIITYKLKGENNGENNV